MPQHRRLARALPLIAGAALTLLVVASYVALVTDDPPWGAEWRDSHFAIGMVVGAAAAAVAIGLLLRTRLPALAGAWLQALAISGLILMLACWMGLVVRAVS